MASTKVICVVQARTGSTRLPRKVLMPIDGLPLIAHVLARVARIGGLAGFVCAIPDGDRDLERVLTTLGVPMIQGSPTDVLARYQKAADAFGADVVMRVTGDCPLLDPVIAEGVLSLYESQAGVEYASNDVECSGFPDGTDVEVFSRAALGWAAREATQPVDREHVTPWLKRHVKCVRLDAPEMYPGIKLSVDDESDLERVRAIVRHLPSRAWRLHQTLRAAEKAGVLGGLAA